MLQSRTPRSQRATGLAPATGTRYASIRVRRSGSSATTFSIWRWTPLLPSLPFDSQLEAVREHLPAGARFEPVAVPVCAGQATFHHSHTLHGSDQNRSSRWRRAVVLNYMCADVRVADASEPLLKGVPSLPVGALVEGEDFPIVLDRS